MDIKFLKAEKGVILFKFFSLTVLKKTEMTMITAKWLYILDLTESAFLWI